MEFDVFRAIERMIEPLRRQLSLVISRAVVESVKDSAKMQGVKVSVLIDEVMDDATEHMQPGGLTHVPAAGSEGIFLTVGGVRDDGVVVCVSQRSSRPTGLEDGETAIYNDGENQSTIKLLKDGSVEVTTGGSAKTTLVLTASGDVELKPGNQLKIGGNPVSAIALAQATDARFTALESAFNAHTHPTSMGPTSAPTVPLTPGSTTASQISYSE